MLAAVDDDRPLEERGRADAVGAAKRLRPERSRTDVLGFRSVSETLVGDDIEQQTLGRRKGDEEIRTCNLLVQGSHFRQRQTANQDTLLLLGSQDLGARRVD